MKSGSNRQFLVVNTFAGTTKAYPEMEGNTPMRSLKEMMAALPPARRKRIEKRAAQLISEELTRRKASKACKLTQVKTSKTTLAP